MKTFLTLLFTFLVVSTSAHARDFAECESFTHVQLKERYKANFLSKNYTGCFGFSTDTKKYKPGWMLITLGDHISNVNNATAARIAYEAFSSFVNTTRSNKKLSDDINQNLTAIRTESKAAAAKIDQDLKDFDEVYTNDAILQLRDNSKELKLQSANVSRKVDLLNQQMAKIPAVTNEVKLPSSIQLSNQNISDPVQREIMKWDGIKNKEFIPFKSLEKMRKGPNKKIADQLLSEIKNERYNQIGLTQNNDLPLLKQVQLYERNESKYNSRLNLINNSPELTKHHTPDQLSTYKAIASEFKNEAERNLTNGEVDKANESIDMAYVALDISTSLPVISSGRAIYELYTGKSLIDGHELTNVEKSLSAASALIDLTPAAVISKGFKTAGILATVGNKLIKSGIAKVGLEESLVFGAKYAQRFADASNFMIRNGIIKYETVKTVIEHKMFLKFIDQEVYVAERLTERLLKYESINSILMKEGINISPSLNKYFENAIEFNKISNESDTVVQYASEYLNIEKKMPATFKSTVNDLTVTRASPAEFNPFDTGPKWIKNNMLAEHRYTMQGENALYSIIGSDSNAINAAIKEGNLSGLSSEAIKIESKTFSNAKVLDLTDERNLAALDVTVENLTRVKGNDKYITTQMIGHVASLNGYDAMIVHSAETEALIYIVLRGF